MFSAVRCTSDGAGCTGHRGIHLSTFNLSYYPPITVPPTTVPTTTLPPTNPPTTRDKERASQIVEDSWGRDLGGLRWEGAWCAVTVTLALYTAVAKVSSS